jgi:hypothetical protein
MTLQDFDIQVASAQHVDFAQLICDEMAESAKARGTGIAQRSPEYVANKMLEGKAVIALHKDGTWAGFCYIETWSHGQFVANSGLIVSPAFRHAGLAKAIKQKIFQLSRNKYPDSKIFGLTTGLAVMKINSELGYEPVTYSELTQDEDFWSGCKSCVNYDILTSKDRKNCMCTAMLFDPAEKQKQFEEKMKKITHKATLLERIENAIKKRMDKFELKPVLAESRKTKTESFFWVRNHNKS